ncbi:MAG: hypothetical protein V1754_10895 [Pseudomonadota bacterium]
MFRYASAARPIIGDPEFAINTLPCGIQALDQLLPHGGFPIGRLTELSGSRSCGKLTIATALCVNTLQRNQLPVWIDGTRSFYPLPALEHNAPLEHLLVIRPEKQLILKAAHILLRDGHTAALVVIDLPFGCAIKQQQLARLRLDAETSGSAILLLTENNKPANSLGTFVCLRLAMRRLGLCKIHVAITKSKLGKMALQTTINFDAPRLLHTDSTV